jgi:hypothetical protein
MTTCSGVDYLSLIRGAPERAADAGTSRVRSGNLACGPESEITSARLEGVTDYRRRWTFVTGDGLDLPGLPAGRRFATVVRSTLEAFAAPREVLFVDGVTCMEADGRVVTSGGRQQDAPRRPSDPAWPLDLLYGVTDGVELVDTGKNGVTHLAFESDLRLADRESPSGVDRRSRNAVTIPVHAWIDDAGLAVRIGYELELRFPDRHRFWCASEFWDFGVDALAVAKPFVSGEVARPG